MFHIFDWIIVLIVLLPPILVIGVLVLVGLKIWKGSQSSSPVADEAKMIQEMYSGLRKMEERIETLEVILLDKAGKGESADLGNSGKEGK